MVASAYFSIHVMVLKMQVQSLPQIFVQKNQDLIDKTHNNLINWDSYVSKE
jgi:hypothetical protein